jgi:hypothetical protein
MKRLGPPGMGWTSVKGSSHRLLSAGSEGPLDPPLDSLASNLAPENNEGGDEARRFWGQE